MKILVTGASSGIGAACAQRLAKAGHQVVGVSRSGKAPEGVVGRVLDIREPVGLSEIVAELGGLDALVNSAGVAVGGPLEDTPLDLVQAQLETNLLGATCLIRAALPYLRASRGRLVHVSSLAVAVPLPYQALYCAAHAGLSALCEALRYELEPVGVRVTVVSPGSVKTGLTASRRTATAGPAYAANSQKALSKNDKDEEGGIGAEKIAAAVEKALLAANPPERLAVAHWHEKASAPLRAILPERLFRKIIASHYGI